jgi:hypothetical protein
MKQQTRMIGLWVALMTVGYLLRGCDSAADPPTSTCNKEQA